MEKILFSKKEIIKLIVWGFVLPSAIFYITSIFMLVGYYVAGAYLYTFKKDLNPSGVWFYGVATLILGYFFSLMLMLLIGAASASAGAFQ